MMFYEVQIKAHAPSVAMGFNEAFRPQIVPDSTDPNKMDWITEANEDVIVGEKVWHLLLFPHLSLLPF